MWHIILGARFFQALTALSLIGCLGCINNPNSQSPLGLNAKEGQTQEARKINVEILVNEQKNNAAMDLPLGAKLPDNCGDPSQEYDIGCTLGQPWPGYFGGFHPGDLADDFSDDEDDDDNLKTPKKQDDWQTWGHNLNNNHHNGNSVRLAKHKVNKLEQLCGVDYVRGLENFATMSSNSKPLLIDDAQTKPLKEYIIFNIIIHGVI